MAKATEIGTLFKRVQGTNPAALVIHPNQNPSGIIIKTMTIENAANSSVTVFASAKDGIQNNADERILLHVGGAAQSVNTLPYPVRLPPGMGLFISAPAAGGGVYVTYDLEN
ncbi:MAG TPA: hypothetical protein VEY95_04145 [Azospirillaceae bacterium]|nr:hypothetical protein [Azospirillaceae bacterium]